VHIGHIIASVWLFLLCVLAPAHAEKRVALVVGNGAYAHADKLTNPVDDAHGMREALAALKFDVIYGTDLDGKALRRLINRFNDRVTDADVALVYFAGHGATFGDAPYVVPVDAEFTSLAEMPAELVAVEELVGELRRAKTMRIAILDACRDNAAEQALKQSRGGPPSRGLAPPKNPAGLIIAYATQHGATAADSGTGGNSPFTAALLANIATPGLDVKEMFFKTGSDVSAATGGRQRPEISVSMYERYALAPGAKPEMKPAETKPAETPLSAEAGQVWATVQNATSIAVIDEFIRQFGAHPVYGPMARARREELARDARKEPEPSGEPSKQPQRQPPGDAVALAVEPVLPGVVLTAAQERTLKPKDAFRECADCPEMVVVPAGKFTMGSPESEQGRSDNEGPQHIVTIGKPFAVGKLHVTVDQFAVFVRETGYEAGANCIKWGDDRTGHDGSWHQPGFAQEGSHPVVCVSWDAGKAYVDWLAKKTRKPYRLLSEAEWEYAARGQTASGAYGRFWFGNGTADLCRHGNGADQAARVGNQKADNSKFAPCNDGYAHTSPAGHYTPNAFGLHDMVGNAWQWTEDCEHVDYNGAPNDGSAWTTGKCGGDRHIVRGGSWHVAPEYLRVAYRPGIVATGGTNEVGFRVARALVP
jgi:formylglycine-generating enzyme required for sulfatase activity